MSRSGAVRQAAAYTALVYALALGVALALPRTTAAPLLSLFTPVISVLVVRSLGPTGARRRVTLRALGLRRAGFASWPAAAAFPVFFLAVAYGAAVLLGVARVRTDEFSVEGLALSLPDVAIALVLGAVLIMGEEIGWRGYLLPRLQVAMSRRRAAVVTGFAHGVFHLPLILLTTTYDDVGSRLVVAPVVVATITCAGVFYAWLRGRSGSLWPVAIAHNTANTVFDLGAAVTTTGSPVALAYVAGETGVATLVGVAAVAAWLLARSPVFAEPVPATEPTSSPIEQVAA